MKSQSTLSLYLKCLLVIGTASSCGAKGSAIALQDADVEKSDTTHSEDSSVRTPNNVEILDTGTDAHRWTSETGITGNIQFAAHREHTIEDRTGPSGGSQFIAVLVHDFDRNGKADIVALDSYKQKLAILMTNHDGSFQPFRSINDIGWVMLPWESMTTEDVNRDGKSDILIATALGELTVILGNGDGTFQTPTITTIGKHHLVGLALRDITGDGKFDAVVADFIGGTNHGIRWLAGDNTGTFQSKCSGQDYCSIPYTSPPTGLLVSDFNQDNKDDILVLSRNDMDLFISNGNGTFNAKQRVGNGGWGFAAGDLNQDGKTDVITVAGEEMGKAIFVYKGKGTGSFETPTRIGTQVNVDYLTVNFTALRDLNGDGILDFTTISYDNKVKVFIGKGDGTFHDVAEFPVGSSPKALGVGDVNGDEKPDLVVANGTETMSVLFNQTP